VYEEKNLWGERSEKGMKIIREKRIKRNRGTE
jgi:hypothetical protein